MSKIVEQARAMAKQVRFEDSEHIPNTDVFKESADLIDALAAEVEKIELLATATHIVMAERDALREKLEALSQPVSMEPVAWGIVASNTGRICQVELDADEVAEHNPKYIVPLYTATQLAAARQQGAEITERTAKVLLEQKSQRIAELEKSNAVLLEALKKIAEGTDSQFGNDAWCGRIARTAIKEVKP